MIPAGLVNALSAWARGDVDRIAQLTTERDALIAGVLNGGKDVSALQSGTINGKTFAQLTTLSKADKLALLTRVLELLGEITPEPAATFADFRYLVR